jgi:PAS domain S-box-containing protein
MNTTEQDRAISRACAADPAFSQLFNAVRDGVFIVDQQLYVVDVNPAACAAYGYTREEFIGLPVETVVHPEDRWQLSIFASTVSSGRPFIREVREIRKDGSIFPVEVRGSLIEYRGKTRYLGMVRDLTRRKRDYRAWMAERAKAQRYLDIAAVMFLALDRRGRVTMVNRQTCETVGCPETSIIGRDWFEHFVPAREQNRLRKMHDDILRGEIRPHTKIEALIMTSTGEERLIAWNNAVIYDDNGLIMGTLNSGEDITKQRKAEKMAAQHREQLIQADKMVALGTLVSGVAHEINNPNNNIMINSTLMMEVWADIQPVLDRYYREHGNFEVGGFLYSEMQHNILRLLQGMRNGAERISRIVSDLKDYARQEDSDLSREVDLAQVIRNTCSLLSSMISKQHAVLCLDLCERCSVRVRGNAQRLEQVLVNLVQNACQALGEKERRIFIRLEQDPQSGQAIVTVEDTGHGIPAEFIERLTEPFFTTRRDSGGTGLGLSVSAGIIKDHGGYMEFASGKARGARVLVYLPLLKTTDTEGQS